MSAERGSTFTILHVEDEERNRALVRAVVERATALGGGSFELVETASLAEALRALATGAFSAVLIDVELPDGSGLELVRDLRGMCDEQRPWIVVLTASVHPNDRQRALQTGADLFVPKPFRVSDLTDVLERITRGSSPEVLISWPVR